MHETILLTGFQPFGEFTHNPSGDAARLLDGRELEAEGFRLVSASLPVEFGPAETRLAELIEEHTPCAIIASGIHRDGLGPYRLELMAKNELHSELTDARPVLAEGSPQVVNTLPLARIKLALERAGFETELSEDAGRHLCNAVFYLIAQREVPAGFLHVPPSASSEDVARALLSAAEVTAARLVEQRVAALA